MLAAVAAIAVVCMPADQEFEGLLLNVPTQLKLKAGTNPAQRAYVGEVQSVGPGGAIGVTQAISVIVTDLDKIPSKPTPEQVIRLHERQCRSQQGFAGQLMKAADTTIDGNPMTVVMGSAAVRGPANQPIGIYHVSTATSFDGKAYEITWYTYKHGQEFTDAVLAVRNIRMKKGTEEIGPEKFIGTQGLYSLLGVPYAWKLPTAATVSPSPLIKEAYAGRYQSSLTLGGYVAQIEIIQFKEAPKNMTPAAMARETTFNWLPETGGPEPVLEGGIYRFDNLAVPVDRKARVEVALKDKLLVVLTVACPKTKELPSRNEISLSASP